VAQVTSYSASRIQQIENQSIVSGFINSGTKKLILVTKGGTQIDAGQVVPDVPSAPAPPAAYLSWAVGAIYISVSSTNPATLLGGGTWARFGQGRVLVSLDENQTEFDTIGETGGAKSVQLTTQHMPYHNHGGATTGRTADHAHSYTAGTYSQTDAKTGSGYAVGRGTYTGGTSGETSDHAHGIPAEGGNVAHNNMQPYITVYMWQRTA
jgi:microcystin-dependent protein